jgi:hypothetical protein
MFDYFYDEHPNYQEPALSKRRFEAKTWENLLSKWSESPHFTVSKIGETTEARPIHEVRFGEGPIPVIAWSQMHGDEATATMALADIFRFLSQDSKESIKIREKLHQKISLYVIPRLNADGAERWTRETALGIDMNRDAQTLNSVEARLLSSWADSKNPTFAFNLHDQNRLYSVGNSAHQTHIAFLATAGDEAGTWTPSRTRAAQLANRLTRLTQAYLPNKVAKWNDEFNPRAFGDTFQSRGYGLLLVESGGAGWDLEKQSLRRINAAILLDALISIADETYVNESTDLYTQLETNERQLFDIKITQAVLDISGKHRADIGLNLVETAMPSGEIAYSWSIEEIGDLSYMHALHVKAGKNWTLAEESTISLGANIHELVFKENDTIAFDLRNFTAEIK